MFNDEKYKQLKKELSHARTINSQIARKINKLRENEVDCYKIESELSKISHEYSVKEVVLLESGEIAQIRKVFGIRHYEVFTQCSALRTGLGTITKVHERNIICPAKEIRLDILTPEQIKLVVEHSKRNRTIYGDE